MSTKAYYTHEEIGKGKPGFSKTRSIIEAAFYGNNVVEVKDLKQAYELAKNCPNVQIEVEHEGSKDMDPGIVLQQKGLTPGKRIDPDSKETITFVVSTYPSIVIPSDLIGQDVLDAKDELNDLGIAVVLSHIENGQVSNKVISVSPDVGTEYIQEGTNSVVTLYYD